jgi:A/G-specific adenine glycosylase
MLKGRVLVSFRKSLLGWFREFQRDLPWRRSKDPYRIWLSEIMLQQTRVAAVIPYYEKFLARFPNIYSLADEPEEEVLRLWSGLGYYSRARNLQKAAKQIVAAFGGKFPRQREKILSLAGVGQYTASAVSSIAFDEKHAVLDGNVARVLSRLGAIRGNLRESRRWQRLQEQAGHLLDPNAPGDWNQAMMELGATLCTPHAPQCPLCPVSEHCEGLRQGIAGLLPEARKKKQLVDVKLVSLVLANAEGKTLLLPPPPKKKPESVQDHVPTLVSNLWHFPTIFADGNPAKASAKQWKKLFHKTAFPAKSVQLPLVRHAVTYRKVTVHSFLLEVTNLPNIRGAKIIELSEVTNLAISNLTRKVATRALHAFSPKRR